MRKLRKVEGDLVAFSLIPREWYGSIYEIDLKELRERGITLLLLDLDNTISPYRSHVPTEELKAWIRQVRQEGLEPFILSNSRKPTRVSEFAALLDIPFLRRAGKPSRTGFRAALEQMGRGEQEAAMVGDQIFTDILGANRSGICSILVKPMKMDTIFRVLRYGVETPFRRGAKRRGSR